MLDAYLLHETSHAALQPWRAAAKVAKLCFDPTLNPLASTNYARTVAATCELFERSTRRYLKPEFGLPSTCMAGERVPVTERVIWDQPFCRVLAFERPPPPGLNPQPKLLVVAPMSGHPATLLRGTVDAFLPTHQVFITDWVDARQVPLAAGRFDLDDYIDYLIAVFGALGPNLHVVAVCQPSVPVLAAVARMEAENHPLVPRSITLIGGPIDTRRSPTAVNRLAQERGIEWFRRHCIAKVPPRYPGFGRDVYPGFLQLTGFMSMNLDRHVSAHWDMFHHLVQGDGESAAATAAFYDEYTSVMDLPAEFYLETMEHVFHGHDLMHGRFRVRGDIVDPGAIEKTALMTVEGENDDICGPGQTAAAHALCRNLDP